MPNLNIRENTSGSTTILSLRRSYGISSSYEPTKIRDEKEALLISFTENFEQAKKNAANRYYIKNGKELNPNYMDIVNCLFPYFKTLTASISYFSEKAKVFYECEGINIIIDLLYDKTAVLIGIYGNEKSKLITSTYRKINYDLKKLSIIGD